VSNSDVAPRVHPLAAFLKEAASWAVLLFEIAIGALVTIFLSAFPTGRSSGTEWSLILGYGLLGFVSLLAPILALRNRTHAARILLLSTPFVAFCFGREEHFFRRAYQDTYTFQEFVLLVGGTTALIVFPGLFWLMTGRWKWKPLVTWGASGEGFRWQPVTFNALLFLVLVIACSFASLYLPLGFNCYKGGRTVSVQTSPRHTVFIGKVLTLGRPLQSLGRPWALLRVEHVYWGLPAWMRGVVFVRGYFSETDKGQRYFVDAYRSDGLLTRFLPLVEFYPCCHSTLLTNAAVDLRALEEGPPKSGVRIIGRVYDLGGSKRGRFVPDSPVLVTGPAGPISVLTDKEGIYDLRDLPPGHYSIRVGARDYRADLKTGDVWGEHLYLPGDAPR